MNEWHICMLATSNSYFDEVAMNSVTVYRSVYCKCWCRPITQDIPVLSFCIKLHYSNWRA